MNFMTCPRHINGYGKALVVLAVVAAAAVCPAVSVAWSPFSGQAIIPCGFDTNGDGIVSNGECLVQGSGGCTNQLPVEQCTYAGFICGVGNAIDALLWFAALAGAVVFTYAGYTYLTSGGSPGKISSAHRMFFMVAIGIIVAMSAWLIISTIENALLNPDQFSILGNPPVCQ